MKIRPYNYTTCFPKEKKSWTYNFTIFIYVVAKPNISWMIDIDNVSLNGWCDCKMFLFRPLFKSYLIKTCATIIH